MKEVVESYVDVSWRSKPTSRDQEQFDDYYARSNPDHNIVGSVIEERGEKRQRMKEEFLRVSEN